MASKQSKYFLHFLITAARRIISGSCADNNQELYLVLFLKPFINSFPPISMLLYNLFKKCIRMAVLKPLIGPRYEIFCLRKIDRRYGHSPATYCTASIIPGKLQSFSPDKAAVFIKPNPSFLNQSMPRHDNKKSSHLLWCQCSPFVMPGLLILTENCPTFLSSKAL